MIEAFDRVYVYAVLVVVVIVIWTSELKQWLHNWIKYNNISKWFSSIYIIQSVSPNIHMLSILNSLFLKFAIYLSDNKSINLFNVIIN